MYPFAILGILLSYLCGEMVGLGEEWLASELELS